MLKNVLSNGLAVRLMPISDRRASKSRLPGRTKTKRMMRVRRKGDANLRPVLMSTNHLSRPALLGSRAPTWPPVTRTCLESKARLCRAINAAQSIPAPRRLVPAQFSFFTRLARRLRLRAGIDVMIDQSPQAADRLQTMYDCYILSAAVGATGRRGARIGVNKGLRNAIFCKTDYVIRRRNRQITQTQISP
jgi:hypothetical protein